LRVNSAVLWNSGIKSAEQGNFSAEQRNSSGIASPTEIRIITTRLGAEKAQRTLLSGDPGWFHRLRADYGLPEIAFGVENIRVVTGRMARRSTTSSTRQTTPRSPTLFGRAQDPLSHVLVPPALLSATPSLPSPALPDNIVEFGRVPPPFPPLPGLTRGMRGRVRG
jgi:hypothetical protein